MSLPVGWPKEPEAVGGFEPQARIPWENPELPALVGLIETIREVLGQPGKFFQGMTREGGLGGPLGFALILGTASMLASFYWQLLQLILIGRFASWLPLRIVDTVQLGPGLVVGVALLVPLVVLVIQFGESLFLQWALWLVGGWHPNFEAAFRVTAYTHAPLIANFLPVLGGVIAGLWGLILVFKALVRVFKLSGGRALAALLLSCFFSLTFFGFLILTVGVVLVS